MSNQSISPGSAIHGGTSSNSAGKSTTAGIGKASASNSPDGFRKPAGPGAGESALPVTDRMGRPLRDLRISVTDECNFRCTYCMPKELFGEGHPFMPPSRYLSFPEIRDLVAMMVPLGVRKLKITGGEPLLRPGLHQLIARLTRIPGIEDVGLITNGFHLKTLGPRLRDAGLTRVTVSLDSLDGQTFAAITGRGGSLGQVLEGIRTSLDLGFSPVKVNMVVQRGVNDHEALSMAEYFRESGVELRFIEYMDVGRRLDFRSGLLVPNREIRDSIHRHWPLEPLEDAYYGEVAESYRYADGGGRVGFISSMTQPFCGSCTRLRLSADGKLYRCLFSGIGLDIKSLIRGESGDGDGARNKAAGSGGWDQAEAALRRFWGIREDRYSELRGSQALAGHSNHPEPKEKRIEMYRMGG
ncbi:GTP 3',8-cyclase MoaA [Spirochaeta lutea]|uniref:GTP 3',8-cyclase MoaA n=1 Tax=Spirochaeta lutea TaxID=1480694 RepID=UPI0009DFE6D0|nr:GTP 3',8-cyclase MoaA [Spirochaeta lutea]